LLIVDGGPLQAAAAAAEVAAAGAAVPVIGIAKRLEEVWPAGEAHPVILPRGSEGLYLLQRIRDEAHRFALKAQRRKRSRATTASALDTIPGVGPVRMRTLLRHFGSVKRMRSASEAELAAVEGIGPRLAAQIHTALAAGSAPQA
jgi:excinuclease ABC subunit C